MGELRNNAWFNQGDRQTVSELQAALDEMKAAKLQGGFAYKQAKARYERLLRKKEGRS